MRLKLTFLAFAAQALALCAFARTDSASIRLGAFVDYSASAHLSHFRQLPGVEFYNPYWDSELSGSLAAGFIFESPAGKNSIFSLKLGLTRENGEFSAADTIDIPNGNLVRRARLNYYQKTKIDRALLEPTIRVRLYDKLRLDAGVFAKVLLGSYFDRYEFLPSAQGFLFPDSSSERFRKSGSIPSLQSITGGLTLGLSYDIPLDRKGRYILSPHIIGNYSLTKNIQEIDWTTHSIRAGISFVFAPPKSAPMEVLPDIPPAESAPKRDEIEDLREKQKVTRLYPLLNYIFFDSASAALPARYARLTAGQAAKFTDSALEVQNTLAIYRTSLNIIGYRLRKFPDAKLALTGCTSGPDEAATLGKERAEAIALYLSEVWKIDRNRLVASGRALPETPSRNISGIGAQENRRVEIASDDARILAPYVAYDMLEEAPPGAYYGVAEEYALLLFDFEKSKLAEHGRASIDLIKKMMKPERYSELPPNEFSVRFLGYSDATGSPGYNEKLSRERAEEVRKLIPVPGSSAVGIGESILLFDNSTPEGRFYCRTVVIRAERKKP